MKTLLILIIVACLFFSIADAQSMNSFLRKLERRDRNLIREIERSKTNRRRHRHSRRLARRLFRRLDDRVFFGPRSSRHFYQRTQRITRRRISRPAPRDTVTPQIKQETENAMRTIDGLLVAIDQTPKPEMRINIRQKKPIVRVETTQRTKQEVTKVNKEIDSLLKEVLPKIKAPRFNEYIGIAAKEKRKRIRAESELSLLKKQKDSLNKKVKKQHKSIKKSKKSLINMN